MLSPGCITVHSSVKFVLDVADNRLGFARFAGRLDFDLGQIHGTAVDLIRFHLIGRSDDSTNDDGSSVAARQALGRIAASQIVASGVDNQRTAADAVRMIFVQRHHGRDDADVRTRRNSGQNLF